MHLCYIFALTFYNFCRIIQSQYMKRYTLPGIDAQIFYMESPSLIFGALIKNGG